MKKFTILICLLALFTVAYGEDGSRLWLQPLPYGQTNSTSIISGEKSPTIGLAISELNNPAYQLGSRTILIGTTTDKNIRKVFSKSELSTLSPESYLIRTVQWNGKEAIAIAGGDDKGALYGSYHLLRLAATNGLGSPVSVREVPAYKVRVLNHWDNLDGSVERGYAGYSLWKWEDLPNTLSPRYKEYARANASIGINGTVLNNVNADPLILTHEYLIKVKALADVFRPYGLKVYLSVNFSSPTAISGLPTSDPLDEGVQRWWKDKAKEIYALIPDFGGFLVKANSEGLPGPQDFGRTHADGANMLADALQPYNGIVMWRAFVYNPGNEERAKQAYLEFTPFDGKFKSNVIIQIKNGPIDFQPREPFSPLFGAMKQTPIMPEFQITQEYLGFSNHLAYLAPMFKECLDSDTYAQGEGSTVAKVTDGSLYGNKISAIAGVANIGEDTNWCGHDFAQANWYAFGRLAWNHQLTSEVIADEWLKMTFTNDPEFLSPITKMMLDSREAVVNYMMPLGLNHIFAFDHHYGPEPWCDVPGARPDWMPTYYHRADSTGLGFDRTTSGSNGVSQYNQPLADLYNNIDTCPEEYLLWFHHTAWNHQMKSGNIMWDELCRHYDKGVLQVREFQKIWDRSEHFVDTDRFHRVQSKLRIQARDAVWWRDACLLYFQTFSKQPIPYDLERPVHDLDDLKKIKLNMGHNNKAKK